MELRLEDVSLLERCPQSLTGQKDNVTTSGEGTHTNNQTGSITEGAITAEGRAIKTERERKQEPSTVKSQPHVLKYCSYEASMKSDWHFISL